MYLICFEFKKLRDIFHMKHKAKKQRSRPKCVVTDAVLRVAEKKYISARAKINKLNLDECRELLNNAARYTSRVDDALPCEYKDFSDQIDQVSFVHWYRTLAKNMVRNVIRTRYPSITTSFKPEGWGWASDEWVYRDPIGHTLQKFKVPSFVDEYIQSEIVGELQDFVHVKTLCKLVVEFLPRTFYEYRDSLAVI